MARINMKLYYFNPNNYGTEYFVMAESLFLAHLSLTIHLNNKAKESNYECYYNDELDKWANVDVNDLSTYPEGYTIDVKEANEIIESEIC